ncbi:hypothetical protein GQR58_024182 [Nymphon striatum]|nr:hypothetical protein GQR58_024182 [Nymphon striatum]
MTFFKILFSVNSAYIAEELFKTLDLFFVSKVTDGKHFIQMIYDNKMNLWDCDFITDKDSVKKFISETQVETKLQQHIKKLTPQLRKITAYRSLKKQCKKHHKFMKKHLKKKDEWFEELKAMHSRGEELQQKMPVYRSVLVGSVAQPKEVKVKVKRKEQKEESSSILEQIFAELEVQMTIKHHQDQIDAVGTTTIAHTWLRDGQPNTICSTIVSKRSAIVTAMKG